MELISQKLKRHVDQHCRNFKKESRLFKLGAEKKINHFHVATYVVNLEHLFFNNAEDILKGSQIYARDPEIGEYYLDKWNEEKGHDAWARADWARMSKQQTFARKPEVIPAMIELTTYLKELLHLSAYDYITYMFVAEYMTPILGPIWMKILDTNLGIKAAEVSALTNHIELDGGHAMEVGHFLDSRNLPLDIQEGLLRTVDCLFEKYNHFFNSLAEAGVVYGNSTRDLTSVSA